MQGRAIPVTIARHPSTSFSTSACRHGPHIRVLLTCHPLRISNSYASSYTRALTAKFVAFSVFHEPNGWLKAVAPRNICWMSHAESRHPRYHRPPSIHIIFHVSMSAWTTHTRSPHMPSPHIYQTHTLFRTHMHSLERSSLFRCSTSPTVG